MDAADRTVGIVLRHVQGADVHRQSVDMQNASGEQLADAGQILDRLGRLNAAEDADRRAEHTDLRTGRT